MKSRSGTARRLLVLPLIYLGLVGLFTAAITLAYTLPREPIVAHAAASAKQLKKEGIFPTVLINDPAYQLDNYTDALMIDTAIPDSTLSPFRAAMSATHGNVRLPSRRFDPIEALARTVNGHRTRATPYAHYWHGYQALLRPTLLVTDLRGIRWANVLLLLSLSTLVLVRLRRQIGWSAAVAFAVSLAATGYVIVPLSMQYSNMTYLTLVAMLAVLAGTRSHRFERYHIELFFVVGMLAAFLDLLTTPLLTLGMPMALALMVRSRSEAVLFRREVSFTVKVCAAWAIGFLGAWTAKTVIATMVLHRPVWEDALNKVAFRTGVNEGVGGAAGALGLNALRLVPYVNAETGAGRSPALYIALAAAVIVVAVALVRYRRPSAEIRRAAHVLLVLPLPYLWFLLTANHARIHYYFTYRTQLMAVFAVVFVVLSSVDFTPIRDAVTGRRRVAADSPSP